MKNPALKSDYLTIFRAILALGIIWHELQPPALALGVPVNIPGRIIVWIFYVLSGYAIGKGFYEGRYSLSWNSIRQFYWRRLLRILPVFYAAYFAIWFLREAPLLSLETVRDLLFLHYWFDLSGLGHAWFLGPLVQLYIVFPLIFFIIEKLGWFQKPIHMLVYVIVLNIVLKYASAIISRGLYGSWLYSFDDRTMLGNLGLFLLGCTVIPFEKGFAKKQLTDKRVRQFAALGFVVIILGAVGYYLPVISNLFWKLPSSLPIGLSAGVLILYCTRLSERVKQSDQKRSVGVITRTFTYLGLISYGMYIWRPFGQEPITGFIPYYQDNYGFFILVFLSVSLITILVASVSYQVMEKPISKLRNITITENLTG